MWRGLETHTQQNLVEFGLPECERNIHDFHENVSYILTLNGLGQIASAFLRNKNASQN